MTAGQDSCSTAEACNAEGIVPASTGLNQYEQERLDRIQRNAAKMQHLAVQQHLADVQAAASTSSQRRPPQVKERRSKAPAQPRQPVRSSARVRGVAADHSLSADDLQAVCTASAHEESGSNAQELMTQQEYIEFTNINPDSISTTGHFTGWVSAAICQQYGIADDAAAAWDQNGGGRFTCKIDKSAIPAHLKAQGWSNARAFSATQLRQNPNSFFYRNVAPDQEQAFGDWSEEEHQLFLDTARKHGVGDKWGLFASYIPQRVGYQCSAYYRDVIVPACLVLDHRFRLSAQGKAVFQG